MAVDTSATLHERCMESVVDEIIALNLTATSPPGSIGSQVFARTIPPDSGHKMPCIVCTIDGEAEEERDGDFEQVEVVYPVRVLILDRTTLDNADPSARKAYLSWRRLIAKHFRDMMALPHCPEVYNMEPKYQAIIDAALAERYQWVVSAMVIGCVTDELRNKLEQPLGL